MKIAMRKIAGNWDLGYVLDKHTLSSTYLGENAYGHPQFNTLRSEAGEALYLLKYRGDWSQVDVLAQEVAKSILPMFSDVALIIPMPPSIARAKQPVVELASALGRHVKLPVFSELLTKVQGHKPLKDLQTKTEKIEALHGAFGVSDILEGAGPWNALLVDDLFDTGASLEAACTALRQYKKIRKIYVAALTYK